MQNVLNYIIVSAGYGSVIGGRCKKVKETKKMDKYKKEAARLCNAIKTLANNPEALNNMEAYLSRHFGEWLEKFAATPGDLSAELHAFSTIEF